MLTAFRAFWRVSKVLRAMWGFFRVFRAIRVAFTLLARALMGNLGTTGHLKDPISLSLTWRVAVTVGRTGKRTTLTLKQDEKFERPATFQLKDHRPWPSQANFSVSIPSQVRL